MLRYGVVVYLFLKILEGSLLVIFDPKNKPTINAIAAIAAPTGPAISAPSANERSAYATLYVIKASPAPLAPDLLVRRYSCGIPEDKA